MDRKVGYARHDVYRIRRNNTPLIVSVPGTFYKGQRSKNKERGCVDRSGEGKRTRKIDLVKWHKERKRE